MAETVQKLARKRLRGAATLIPESFTAVAGAFGMSAGTFGEFALRRRRRGAEVWLISDTGLRVNLSMRLDEYPRDFAAARVWVRQLEIRHGLHLDEEPSKRIDRIRMAPEDRALYRAGRAAERWLTSDDPRLYAEAMMRCKHPAGFCSADGYCHLGACDMEMSDA